VIYIPLIIVLVTNLCGIGLPTGHAVLSDVDLLGASWYYDWGNSGYKDSRYVPMSWAGEPIDLPQDYNGYLLILNEPEHQSQANLTPEEGARRVIELSKVFPKAKLIIGGVGYWGRGWLLQFVFELKDYQPAGWHVHGYVEAWLTTQDIIDYWLWARDILPGGEFWITEFADTNTDSKELIDYVKQQKWINRYAWFANRLNGNESWYPSNWINNPALIVDGQLTERGKYYRNK
jgi:hypothetical protein